MSLPFLSGWLSPTAEFTPCGYGKHCFTADQIMYDKKLPMITNDYYLLPLEGEALLEYMGYLKFGTSVFGAKRAFVSCFYSSHSHLTTSQKRWINSHIDEMTLSQQKDCFEIENFISTYVHLD